MLRGRDRERSRRQGARVVAGDGGAGGTVPGVRAVALASCCRAPPRTAPATCGAFPSSCGVPRPRSARSSASRGIVAIVAFLLLYRFGEAQLVKMVAPFLLDAARQGRARRCTTAQVGLRLRHGRHPRAHARRHRSAARGRRAARAQGVAVADAVRHPPARRRVHLPRLRAAHEPARSSRLCVALEQFGYGFGFTAYLLYMIHIARGEHQTAHYAICTGFMAMGMMFPGMWSGWLAGPHRLQALLRVGHPRHGAELPGRDAHSVG